MEKQYIWEFIYGTNVQGVLENIQTRVLSEFERSRIEDKVTKIHQYDTYYPVEVPIQGKRVFVNLCYVKASMESQYIAPQEETTSTPEDEKTKVDAE